MMNQAMKKASQQMPMIGLGSMVTGADSTTRLAAVSTCAWLADARQGCSIAVGTPRDTLDSERQAVAVRRRKLANFGGPFASSNDEFVLLERSGTSPDADNRCVLVSPAGDDFRAMKLHD